MAVRVIWVGPAPTNWTITLLFNVGVFMRMASTVTLPITADERVTAALPFTVVAVDAERVPSPLVMENSTVMPSGAGYKPLVTVAVNVLRDVPSANTCNGLA